MRKRDSSISVMLRCTEIQRQFTAGEIPKYSHFATNGLHSSQRQESTRERIKNAFLSAKRDFREVDWVGHIQLMFPYLRYFEYASQQAKSRLSEMSLYEINKWRQDSFVSLSTLKYLRHFILHWSSETTVAFEEDISLLLKDVDDVSAQTQDLIRALSESKQFVTSLIQLFDMRQSVTEAVNVRRVTYIALVFVPLSWASSLFSMAENYSPGGSKFWIYCVVALPLLIMVFISSNTLPIQVWDRIREFMVKITGI
jgi:Mg2+ and Co2+ transporter CorA